MFLTVRRNGCGRVGWSRRRGATLIELVIAVAIVGILAAVAIPALLEYIREARLSEATANVQGIMDSEQAYFVRHGRYSAALPLCPPALPAGKGTTQLWPAPANLVAQCGQGWMDLGWRPDKAIYFQYRVVTHFDPTDADPFQINPTTAVLGADSTTFAVDWTTEGFAADPIEPWCTVEARADTDGDTKLVYVRTNSYNRKMFVARDEEGTW